MKCPKCKSKIGLRFHEQALLERGYAQGFCCFICGFWLNGQEQEALFRLKQCRSRRRS
jgi:hypothetical protein